jgi:hypothetical protein
MHPKCIILFAALWMVFGVSTAVADDSAAATAGNGVQADWARLQSLAPAGEKPFSDGLTSGTRREILDARWKIAERGGVPKWDGKQWIDVAGIACGDAGADETVRRLIAELNYWELAYGRTALPPDLRKKTVRGEADAAIARYVGELRDMGVGVELDPDAGFWKTVPGASPAAWTNAASLVGVPLTTNELLRLPPCDASTPDTVFLGTLRALQTGNLRELYFHFEPDYLHRLTGYRNPSEVSAEDEASFRALMSDTNFSHVVIAAYATSASNQFVRVAASVQENYTTRTLTENGTLTLCNGTNGWKIAVFDDDKWHE